MHAKDMIVPILLDDMDEAAFLSWAELTKLWQILTAFAWFWEGLSHPSGFIQGLSFLLT